MRIKISYKTDKIPNSYRMMFVSLIKSSLELSDSNHYNELYNFESVKNKRSKNFSFSVYLNDFSKQDEEILTDRVDLYISSPDAKFMINLYNGLNNQKQFNYKNYSLEKIKISLLKEKDVNGELVILKTLSPIVLKNKIGKFLELGDFEFENELNYIANVTLANYRGYGLKERINFTNIKMQMVIAKEKISSAKNIVYIKGNKGVFGLSGNNEDLRDLSMLGLGFRRNQGFGMIQII